MGQMEFNAAVALVQLGVVVLLIGLIALVLSAIRRRRVGDGRRK